MSSDVLHSTLVSPLSRALCLAASLFTASCRGALTAPFTPPEAGGAPWNRVASPHFLVYSDLPAPEAREAAEELERIHTTLLDLGFNYAVKPEQQTRVVLFRREAEYKAVAPAGSAGFFTEAWWFDAPASEPVAVLFGDLTKATRRTLQHELTHRFVRFYYPRAPRWLNEGLAEYFETTAVEGGVAILGRAAFTFRKGLSWAGATIPTGEARPLRTILDFEPSAFLPDREKINSRESEEAEWKRVHANRGSAWALVHLFKNGPELYRSKFNTFSSKIGEGVDADRAWQDAFGDLDPAQIEADFEGSLVPAGRELITLRTPYEPGAPPRAEVTPLSPAEVHLLWATLRGPQAEAETAAALQLDPELPAAWRMWGRILMDKKDFEAAESALQRAVSLSPEDPLSLFELFRLHARRARGKDARPEFLERAEALLPRLLPRASSLVEVQNSVAWNLGLWGRPNDAMPLALRAVELDPSCWECHDTLALLVASAGDLAKAIEVQSLAIDLMPEWISSADRAEVIGRLRGYQRAAVKATEESHSPDVLPSSVLRVIVQRRRGELERCLAAGLARKPDLKGVLYPRFVIERDGTPSSVTDDGSTLQDPQVVKCMLDELAKLKFPARDSGEAQTVTFPVAFSPTDTEKPSTTGR